MTATAEILHDRHTDDPTEWQPAASLAACLGIAERTVRHRVKQGTVERFRAPDGRTYYRAPEPHPATHLATGNASDSLPAIVATHLAAVATAHRELAQVRADAAHLVATHLATVADLEAERTRAAELARALEAERLRLARIARLAAAPWYAFRRRRQLLRQLEDH